MSICKSTKNILDAKDLCIEAKAVLLFMVADNMQLDHMQAIINKLDMGKTKAYRILDELIEKGYVCRGEREERNYKPLSFTRKTLRMIK